MSLADNWDDLSFQPTAQTWVNSPILFEGGQFAGRVIITQLQVVQDPLVGRKFSSRDRRPLDPPPVIRMRLWEVLHANSPEQTLAEVPADQVQESAFVVSAALFPVLPPTRELEAGRVSGGAEHFRPLGRSWNASRVPYVEPGVYPLTALPENHPDVIAIRAKESTDGQGFTNGPPSTLNLPREAPKFVGGEETDMSSQLHGENHVSCSKVIAQSADQLALYFVFSDLSVKTEGYYSLRYRVVNLVWRVSECLPTVFPFLAECASAPFAVYSTKEFPGLYPSTALTQHLNRYHVRVNMREPVKKKGKGGKHESESTDEEAGGSTQNFTLQSALYSVAPEFAAGGELNGEASSGFKENGFNIEDWFIRGSQDS